MHAGALHWLKVGKGDDGSVACRRHHNPHSLPDQSTKAADAIIQPVHVTGLSILVLCRGTSLGACSIGNRHHEPMLQGDVGCGKTVVAFLALLAAVGSGHQGALLAPTEVLTEQHMRKLGQLLDRLPEVLTCGLLTLTACYCMELCNTSVWAKARHALAMFIQAQLSFMKVSAQSFLRYMT